MNLSTLANDAPASPCYFTHAKLPSELSVKRYPKKKKPFTTVAANPLLHTLDLVLPDELWQLVHDKIENDIEGHEYYKTTMTLLDVISGEFFNQYIKIGNIAMISAGRPLVDNRYRLLGGILQLELDKANYERCGLQGKAIESTGRKHVKQRFRVEINLRLPSMVRGKKCFARVVAAFSKVLTAPVDWLFIDLESPRRTSGPVIGQLQRSIASKQVHLNTVVPLTQAYDAVADTDYQEELLEWLGLILIGSPRTSSNDKVDPYICRYHLPNAAHAGDQHLAAPQILVHLRWRGLLSSEFVMKILWIVKEYQERDWFSLNGMSFEGNAYTIVFGKAAEVLVWEMTSKSSIAR